MSIVEIGKTINISELMYKLTGNLTYLNPSEEGPGKTYIPALTLDMSTNALVKQNSLSIYKLPNSFNWNDNNDIKKYKKGYHYPIIISPGNQLKCGSCWAWATTTSLGDRIAVANKTRNPNLGPSYLMSCGLYGMCGGDNSGGCNGGNIANALKGMVTADSDCWSYGWCTGSCSGEKGYNDNEYSENKYIPEFGKYKNKCYNNKDKLTKYYVDKDSVYALDSFYEIQRDIFENGPIPTGFVVFIDFIVESRKNKPWYETNGICIHLDTDNQTGLTKDGDKYPYSNVDKIEYSKLNQVAGGHAVVIVGWGVDKVKNFLPKLLGENIETIDLPYWIIRNSWGIKWNGNGYFKVAQSNKKLGINMLLNFDFINTFNNSGGVISFKPIFKNKKEIKEGYKFERKNNKICIILAAVLLSFIFIAVIQFFMGK